MAVVLTRRRSLSLLSRVAVMGMLPSVLLSAGCQPAAPQPFRVGKVVSPPQGCTALRRDDPRGDC